MEFAVKVASWLEKLVKSPTTYPVCYRQLCLLGKLVKLQQIVNFVTECYIHCEKVVTNCQVCYQKLSWLKSATKIMFVGKVGDNSNELSNLLPKRMFVGESR